MFEGWNRDSLAHEKAFMDHGIISPEQFADPAGNACAVVVMDSFLRHNMLAAGQLREINKAREYINATYKIAKTGFDASLHPTFRFSAPVMLRDSCKQVSCIAGHVLCVV